MEESPLHTRLTLAAGDRSYRQLGELTSTHPETVRRYMQGTAPSVKFIGALCRALGLNPNWLLSGDGPMLASHIASVALERAGPADLLRYAARDLETLTARLDRLETYTATLESRIQSMTQQLPASQIEVNPASRAPEPTR